MLALITGGAGCLGTALTERLRARGARVRVLDQRPRAEGACGDEYLRGDVGDAETVRHAARGAELIFNLAALQPVSRAGGAFWRINVGGTKNVLDAAKSAGAHVVHLSSSIVYGVPSGRPLRESDPVRPAGEYGKSKVAAEEAARSSGASVSVLRPRVIMGPGRLGLFSILFHWVAEGRRIYLIGSGENRFQMTDSGDLADACLAAAERRANGTFNIGSDDVPRVRELLGELIHHAGSRSRLVSTPAPLARAALSALDRWGLAPLTAEHYLYGDKTFLLDTTRARAELGWRPRKKDGEALCSAYDHFRSSVSGHDYPHDRPPPGLLDLLRQVS